MDTVLPDVTRGNGTVTFDDCRQVSHVNFLVATVLHDSTDGADREFAAFLPTHQRCAGFGYVYLEVGISLDCTDTIHLKYFAKFQSGGTNVTADIFIQSVEGEVEIERACRCAKVTLKTLLSLDRKSVV